jgi:hypothetical protein
MLFEKLDVLILVQKRLDHPFQGNGGNPHSPKKLRRWHSFTEGNGYNLIES